MTKDLVYEIGARLEADEALRGRFSGDPVGALRASGEPDLAERLVTQAASVRSVADRLLYDRDFLRAVVREPLPALSGAGVPLAAVPAFLQTLSAPAEVIGRAFSDVEAHGLASRFAGTAAMALAALALAGPASAGDTSSGDGTDSQSILLQETAEMQEMNMSFNLEYLRLQSEMADENRRFTAISNIMETDKDTVANSISNVR